MKSFNQPDYGHRMAARRQTNCLSHIGAHNFVWRLISRSMCKFRSNPPLLWNYASARQPRAIRYPWGAGCAVGQFVVNIVYAPNVWCNNGFTIRMHTVSENEHSDWWEPCETRAPRSMSARGCHAPLRMQGIPLTRDCRWFDGDSQRLLIWLFDYHSRELELAFRRTHELCVCVCACDICALCYVHSSCSIVMVTLQVKLKADRYVNRQFAFPVEMALVVVVVRWVPMRVPVSVHVLRISCVVTSH